MLTELEFMDLKNSLMFLYVSELKELARNLFLIDKGNKRTIILRILHFLHTGQKQAAPKFAENVIAKRGCVYPLHQDTLMLRGAYKNDLKTRLFFKQLIGEHFHFSAFGIDWLNDRWMDGNPPTYQEFAKMWQEEHERRKNRPVAPKEEWAYINFAQNFLKKSPHSSSKEMNLAWKQERQEHKARIEVLLKEKQVI